MMEGWPGHWCAGGGGGVIGNLNKFRGSTSPSLYKKARPTTRNNWKEIPAFFALTLNVILLPDNRASVVLLPTHTSISTIPGGPKSLPGLPNIPQCRAWRCSVFPPLSAHTDARVLSPRGAIQEDFSEWQWPHWFLKNGPGLCGSETKQKIKGLSWTALDRDMKYHDMFQNS